MPDCAGPKIWPCLDNRAKGTPAAAGVAAVVCGVRVTVPIEGLAIWSVLTPILIYSLCALNCGAAFPPVTGDELLCVERGR
jgi:hypothetical protein